MMNKFLIKLFAIILFSLLPAISFAQDNDNNDSLDALDSDISSEQRSSAFDEMLNKEYPSVYDEMNEKPSNEGDRQAWLKVSNSMDKEALLDFMDKYPNSEYAKEAMQRINEIDIMEAKQEYKDLSGKKYESIPPELTEDALKAAAATPKKKVQAPDGGSVKNPQQQGEKTQQNNAQQQQPINNNGY